MKPGAKMKSKKKRAGRRGKKNKARERKTLAAASTVPHSGTLANWVAGMKAMGEKIVHRGNTLADWVRDAS